MVLAFDDATGVFLDEAVVVRCHEDGSAAVGDPQQHLQHIEGGLRV